MRKPNANTKVTDAIKEFIRDNYLTMQYVDIAKIIGLSIPTVNKYVKAMGLPRKRGGRNRVEPSEKREQKWYTPAEDEFIIANPKMSIQEVANVLGRSRKSIDHRRSYLRKHYAISKQSTCVASPKRPIFVDVPLPERRIIEAGGWVVRWNFGACKMQVVGAVTAY